jgi:hypothetical protein
MRFYLKSTNQTFMKRIFTDGVVIPPWKNLTLFLLVLFAFTHGVLGQVKTITGKVVDETDLGIPGANILIKGTTKGAVTDLDGNFTLDLAPDEKSLVVSYIGYETKEVTLTNESNIVIKLGGDIHLGEIIVTAAGIERNANNLGYAVTTLDSDRLSQKTNRIRSDLSLEKLPVSISPAQAVWQAGRPILQSGETHLWATTISRCL